MDEKQNKYSECIRCENMFDCKNVKDKPDYCLNFKERKKENG